MKKLFQILLLICFGNVLSQCPTGDVILNSQEAVNQFIIDYPNCEIITGNLEISDSVSDLSSLDYIIEIQGGLTIENTNLSVISNFNSLEVLGDSIEIVNNSILTSILGFNNLVTFNQFISIGLNDALLFINGFNSILEFGELVIYSNNSLLNISGFMQLQVIVGSIIFDNCPILVSIPDFVFLNSVGYSLQIIGTSILEISGFNGLQFISGLDEFSGGLIIQSNEQLVSVSGFGNLETITVDFNITNNPDLESITGFSSLQIIGQSLNISNNATLYSLNGLESLAAVGNGNGNNSVIFQLFSNTTLDDCNAICALITSDNILGLKNIQDNLLGCNTEMEIETNCTTTDPPQCTNLVMPLDGAIEVPTDTDFVWNAVPNATGYRINIGTNDIFFGEFDAGNNLSYNLSFNLPENTLIYVRLIPYNSYGDIQTCDSETFTTGTESEFLECTNLTTPLDGAIDVPIDTSFSWSPVENATGYRIYIAAADMTFFDDFEAGNALTYQLPFDLPQNMLIYVVITPYNADGDAEGCTQETFITGFGSSLPNCTNLTMPLDGATNVSVSTDFTWNSVAGATGYIIAIGTNTTLLNAANLGNVTFYDLPFDLPENTEIFVEIIPFNAVGEAIGCLGERFTTGGTIAVPNCTSLIEPINMTTNVPVNTNLMWSSVPEAEGYLISLGTIPGATDIVNSFDVGSSTTFNPTLNLPASSQIYVTIIPYNHAGEANGCQEERFTTETEVILDLPSCTSLLSPFNGAQNISLDVNLVWNIVLNATGYIVSVGTSLNGADILNNVDVGNVNVYDLPESLPQDAQIYVHIVPYNQDGEALNCNEDYFFTESRSYTIPLFFTPNNDTYNDIWLIKDPEQQVKEVVIFDRYGKQLKVLNRPPFFWDGYFNNQLLPVNDYWYLINLYSGKQLYGNFSLKL